MTHIHPTLFLDLHGVLVQTPLIFEEYKRLTVEHLIEHFSLNLEQANLRYDKALKRWEDVAFAYLRNPTKKKVGIEFLKFLESCDKLFPKFLYEGLPLNGNCDKLRQRPFEYSISSKTEEVLYPEVRETLRSLYDQGYNMFVASSSHSSHIKGVLESNDIEEFFGEAIGFDTVASTKHTLNYYQKMLLNAHATAQESVMIGNSLHEVLKPRILGMKTIHINRERSVPLEVRKMADLSLADLSLLPIHLDVIELI